MPRREKKYHYLYKTTNLINGKFYIGMHSTDDLNDGYLGSGTYLWYSIKKHGKENFKIKIIEFFKTRKELSEREKELVNEDLLNESLCMNLKPGGQNPPLFGKYNGFYGKKRTKEHKEKMLDGLLKKLKDPIFNKLRNDKISKINKGRDNGKWKNRKHKETSKQLMKEKAKLRIGNKNSQFETCWIYKNNKNKKIKKDQIENWVLDGWIKGRKY